MSVEDAEATAAAWRRVVAWCGAHAPVTADALNGPADKAALTAVQHELGHVWTDDLVACLAVSDGAKRDYRASIIPPFFIPLSLDRIQADWQMLTGISRDVGDPAELATFEAEVAGTRSPHFLRQWVPIAENLGGEYLFVDLRQGNRLGPHPPVGPAGAVYQFWCDDGFHGLGAFWPTVRHMATSIADALEGGRWAPDHTGEHDMEPTVTDGAMAWTDTDEWETLAGD